MFWKKELIMLSLRSVKTTLNKKAGIYDLFCEYLSQNKMKLTRERAAIARAIEDFNDRFSIEEVHTAVDDGFHIALATTYNTISLMVKAGLLKQHATVKGNEKSRLYERVIDMSRPKLKLICSECGSTKVLKDPELGRLLDPRRFTTFAAEIYDLKIWGQCSRCQRKRRPRKTKK